MTEEKIKHPFTDVFGTPKHPDGTEYTVWEITADLMDYWNRLHSGKKKK